MLNTFCRTLLVGLGSTALGLLVTSMATTATPAFAYAPLAPMAAVSVL